MQGQKLNPIFYVCVSYHRRYMDQMKFPDFMAVSFIIFLHIPLLYFVLLYIRLYVLYAFV